MVEFTVLLGVLIGISVILVGVIIFLLFPRKNIGKEVGEMVKENKDIDEILLHAKKKKWKEKEVKMYYLAYTMEGFLKQGYSLEEVKSMAVDSGWPAEMVDIVSKKLG